MRRLFHLLWSMGVLGALITVGAAHEEPGKPGHQHATPEPAAPAGIRITHEQLHALGGVPRGWKFTIPLGDPAAGKEVFAALECFKCHNIRGETFAPSGLPDRIPPNILSPEPRPYREPST